MWIEAVSTDCEFNCMQQLKSFVEALDGHAYTYPRFFVLPIAGLNN